MGRGLCGPEGREESILDEMKVRIEEAGRENREESETY